jgi:hypothetical protein
MFAFDAVDGPFTDSHESKSQMQTVATVGLDIARSVFQVHRIDAAGQSSAVS